MSKFEPFSAECADEKSVDRHVGIRVSHPASSGGKMRFSMFSQDGFPLKLFAAALEVANVALVRIFVVFLHELFAFERHLAFFHRAIKLKKMLSKLEYYFLKKYVKLCRLKNIENSV